MARSTYLYYDADGRGHTIEQAEGGEQGDPLMPGLYAVGVHGALMAANASLAQGEELYAFLEDTYVTTSRDRTAQAFRSLQAALKTHANIDLHLGKTKAWNTGEEPPGLREIVGGGPDDPPTWVGDATLHPEQHGLMVLGTPLGSAAYVQAAL